MHKLRKVMVAVASAAMVLGTMGVGAASAASSTATCVSRAQFIYDFDVAAGIAPVYPASSDFSDVSSSSPYYGYIEAAFKAGYINGTGNGQFSPNGCLTRAQIAKIEVTALGDASAAATDATSATTFTDDSSIPSWARGYVVEAVSLGLVHGYPDGSFSPNASMTATDEGYFLSQYKTTEAAGTLTVTASANDVAPGQQVTLTATGTNEPVTFSTTSGAVISGATFIGSTAGTYTVTGQTASGLKGTVTVAVYGAAVGVKVNVPSSAVVANSMSQYPATVDIVDANGNTVANDTNNITLNGATIAIAGVDNGSGTGTTGQTLAAVNGVATFTIDSGSVPGASETLTGTDATISATATGTLTTTAQVATSLSVSAPTYVEANKANTDPTSQGTASVTVEDQTGNPMLSGAYSVSMSLTGPATFGDGTTGPETSAFVGPATTADFPFTSTQSETGAITFTASATGLTSGAGTTTAVIAGAPAAIQLTADATTGSSFADAGAGSVQFDAQIVDSHGYPVAVADPLTFSLADSQGNDATAATNEYLTATPGTDNTASTGTENVTITDTHGKPNAGTYTVSVSDTLGLTAPTAQAFTITPGAANRIAITPAGDQTAALNVSAASPKVTFTAQVEDANGNAVSGAGVPVTFLGGSSSTDGFTLGGVASSLGGATFGTTTDASGQATATFSAEPYTGQTYTVWADNTNLVLYNTVHVSVQSTVGTSVAAATYNGGVQESIFTSTSSAGTITVKATVTDQYGTPVNGDYVDFTYGTQTYKTNVSTNGVYTASFNATTAGTGTITATDSSVAAAPSGSAVVSVNAGTFYAWEIVDAAGDVVGTAKAATFPTVSNANIDTGTLSVTANTPVELWIKPIDVNGNPIVLSSADVLSEGGPLTLAAPSVTTTNGTTAGAFRLTTNGSDVTTYTLSAGLSQIAVWYVNSQSGTPTNNFDGAAY